MQYTTTFTALLETNRLINGTVSSEMMAQKLYFVVDIGFMVLVVVFVPTPLIRRRTGIKQSGCPRLRLSVCLRVRISKFVSPE